MILDSKLHKIGSLVVNRIDQLMLYEKPCPLDTWGYPIVHELTKTTFLRQQRIVMILDIDMDFYTNIDKSYSRYWVKLLASDSVWYAFEVATKNSNDRRLVPIVSR